MMKTMKRLLTILIAMGLASVLATAAMAATDTQNVTCTVNGLADAIVAPADVELTCDRKGSAEQVTAGTITYGTEAATRDVTVQKAVAGEGSEVVGVKLAIRSATLSIAAGTEVPTATALTLTENVAAADPTTVLADDILLKLDASGVAAGAANLDTPWTYTLTYTLADVL